MGVWCDVFVWQVGGFVVDKVVNQVYLSVEFVVVYGFFWVLVRMVELYCRFSG